MTTNPYKRLRLLTATSQVEFANKYDLSRTMMGYIESGQVVELSERMIVSLGQECHEKGVNAKEVLVSEYNAEDLQSAYQTWKSNERMGNAHLFQVPITGSVGSKKSPFQTYVDDVAGSQQRFCKLLKVQASAVHQYAKGEILTMPKVIEDALNQVQFRRLQELKVVQGEWLLDGKL